MKANRIIPVILLIANLCFSQTGWYQVNSGTNKHLTSSYFINSNTGFIGGKKGTLLVTHNSGSTWQNINLSDTAYDIRKIYFKDQLTGYILANINIDSPITDTLHSRIYKTTDGGQNWFINNPRITEVFLNNIEFINNTGYMSGGLYAVGPSKFFKSTDNGNSWTEIPLGFNGAALTKKFIDANTGLLGVMNNIYRTTNGGENWTSVFQTSQNHFNIINDIRFINNTTGFAAGGYMADTTQKRRYILKTIDAGITWNYILNDSTAPIINSLMILNENVIYASGAYDFTSFNRGFIIKTVNGGISWTNESLPYSIALNDIKNTSETGFAVGFNGTIFKNDHIVSVIQISTTVPSSINLHQNYPNPFNPTTTINFDIPKQSFVLLKVFDMAGKEVQNLFQGIKSAGTYQVKFDGVNLNSGVYFYKLMTDGASITKSMVLVK